MKDIKLFMNNMNNFKIRNIKIKNELDNIGKGMCLAKWTQTTIHLGLGHTHSCHHPRTHLIPIEEIQKNPSALHNTPYKKQRRKEMLEGERPVECNYCWNVEDLENNDQFSDRVLKSSESWSYPFFEEIMSAGYAENFNPKYVEVSFSNVCNFKCSYCMPSVSSQWMEEVERYGGYPTSTNFNNLEWVKENKKMPIPLREYNPYIEAFWKWWPDLYKDVLHFRITGGEPLLDKNTFKILDYVIENPNPNLELSLNSNLVVPESLYKNFIEKIKIITENNAVKRFTLYTSCEAHGKSAEYIRHGLNYRQWIDNFYYYLENIPNANVVIMATYNALSVTSFLKFLVDVYNLMEFAAEKKSINGALSRVCLDIPYLNNPPHQNVKILTEDFSRFFDEQLEFMEKNKIDYVVKKYGFSENEIHKLRRVRELLKNDLIKNETREDTVNRKDFVLFVDEHDRRRKTNFLETFPEMKDFYNLCKSYK